ncbi:uncharacterized protein LOC6560460 [Drosophila grimshawi]|uniref:GH19735 n=1 Tax=Drosophila grimshawi TaxID=7222 RepID=B4J4J4_DROGR|nr:uncharacterized protein LOC6560460 [Drosophila grimshawi]EDW02699.1 GH19735 [Drosophila grimshawi]
MLTSLCCMRLNTAGVVLGWLGVVGSFVLMILASVVLGNSDVLAKQVMDHMDVNYEQVHTAIIIVCSVYLAMVILNLLSSALLILGTMKERHLLLLPWLINSGVGLIFAIIYQMAFLFMSVSGGAIGNAFPALILSLLALALQIYIYYGIYSLFKQIQASRDQQRPLIVQSQGMAVPQQSNTYPTYTKI